MDRDFESVVKSSTPSSAPTKSEERPTIKLRSLTENEKVVQNLSESLDRERGRNFLLQGRIQKMVDDIQKHRTSGSCITLIRGGATVPYICRTDEQYVDLISYLLILLKGYGEITSFQLDPLEPERIEGQDDY